MTDAPTASDASSHPQPTALTALQIEVAQAFFALDAARGFLLAGGAALAAQGMIVRPTLDLDMFTSPGRGVVADAGAALEEAAVDHGWTVRRVRDGAEFMRLVVTGPAEVVVVDPTPRRSDHRPRASSARLSTPTNSRAAR